MVANDDSPRDLDALLEEVETLLKSGTAAAALGADGVNTSIALVAVQGLRAYVRGDKAQAADDLATAAEELRARLEDARRRSKDLS